MASNKIVAGGAAKIKVDGNLIGIFESCTINESLSTEDVYTLGQFGPREITPVSYNVVTLNCSGFRVAGHGVKLLPKFPKIADLISLGAFSIQVVDRRDDEVLAEVIGCVAETNNVNFNARANSRINVTYKGILMTDENSKGDGEGNPVPFI